MSLLYNVLFAWKCKGTHHKLALDALPRLSRRDAEPWTNLFLSHIEIYLDGSKAPDKKFRDFRNHVLHVSDNWWGGAPKAAARWYEQTVRLLQSRNWADGIYAAGVLSHYITDPIQPFHTGQSDAETRIHRAAEWSISRSYDDLRQLLLDEQGGWPAVRLPAGDDWLEELVCQGAEVAHRHYEPLVRQYDFRRGVKDPPAGLTPDCRRRVAGLIGHAVSTWSLVLNRALDEAAVAPPQVNVSVEGVLSALSVPVFWVTKRMADQQERKVVEAIYRELQATGDVVENLPEDDRVIRELHAREVLGHNAGKSVPAASGSAPSAGVAVTASTAGSTAATASREAPVAVGSAETISQRAAPPNRSEQRSEPVPTEAPPVRREVPAAEPAPVAGRLAEAPVSEAATGATEGGTDAEREQPDSPLRFHLELNSPVVDAPSIGPKTASRLKRATIRTVRQLLEADPQQVADRLRVRHISADVLEEWQHQARLVCRVPELRGHDAQMIVACGIETAEELAESTPDRLLEDVTSFLETNEGQRVLRSGRPPDLREVSHWIHSAGQARVLSDLRAEHRAAA